MMLEATVSRRWSLIVDRTWRPVSAKSGSCGSRPISVSSGSSGSRLVTKASTVGRQRLGEADGGTCLLRSEIVEWKWNEDDFTARHPATAGGNGSSSRTRRSASMVPPTWIVFILASPSNSIPRVARAAPPLDQWLGLPSTMRCVLRRVLGREPPRDSPRLRADVAGWRCEGATLSRQ